jgi:pheromone shutdown-related protein TraB
MKETITRLNISGREITLLGTAHVSQESVRQVEEYIATEKPDRVCVEIDQSRYRSLTDPDNWRKLNIHEVLRKKQGFLLLANLVLASFQKRLGLDLGVKPGTEMIRAIEVARKHEIPFSLCDREIQITLRRAWMRSGLWNRMKLLAALLEAIFRKEEMSSEEIEGLKDKDAIQDMMEDLARELPRAKEVLIDERDRFLAARIFETTEPRVLAVVGAGHVPGMVARLTQLEATDPAQVSADMEEISRLPDGSWLSRVVPYIIPAVVIGLIGWGFYRAGWETGVRNLSLWFLVNGSLSALGAAAALAHPVTVLVSFIAAPITSMNPTIGVGIVSGLVEALLRKPRVQDFETLQDDITSVRGFFRNRITRVLLVFFFSTLGSAVGTFIALPMLFPGR